MTDDLPHLLHDAAEDEHFTAPDLRPRARSRARRRRVLVGGTVAAVVLATVGIGAAVVNSGQPVTVTTPAAPTTTPATPKGTAKLTDEQIVELCAPDDTTKLEVAHPHDYKAGQLVTLLDSGSGETRLCRIPSDGGPTSVDVDPSSNESILESATEALKTCNAANICSYDTPDLRKGEVLSTGTVDGTLAALVADGETRWLVVLPPVDKGESGAKDLTGVDATTAAPTFANARLADGDRIVAVAGLLPDDSQFSFFGVDGVPSAQAKDGHYLSVLRRSADEVLEFNVQGPTQNSLGQGTYYVKTDVAKFVSSTSDSIIERCEPEVKSLRRFIGQPEGGGITEVVASTVMNQYLIALVISDGERFTCEANQYGITASNFSEDAPVPGSVWDREVGNNVFIQTSEWLADGTVYMGYGDLEKNAAKIEFKTEHGEIIEVDVVDTIYTALFKTEQPARKITYRVLDANGKELHSGLGFEWDERDIVEVDENE